MSNDHSHQAPEPGQSNQAPEPDQSHQAPESDQSHQAPEPNPVVNQHYDPILKTGVPMPNVADFNYPQHTNTAVKLSGLPGYATAQEVLMRINSVGRVYSIKSFRSQVEFDSVIVAICFFERAAAERFLGLCISGEFHINGRRPRAS
ncbi:hypothetical protein F5Y05DRAFT_422071 [Hypoxylon sp. FL0543]|nr:hypothetical protein F5Y05DRAFT_422071 [Hypoxylon sp. FL0543]